MDATMRACLYTYLTWATNAWKNPARCSYHPFDWYKKAYHQNPHHASVRGEQAGSSTLTGRLSLFLSFRISQPNTALPS